MATFFTVTAVKTSNLTDVSEGQILLTSQPNSTQSKMQVVDLVRDWLKKTADCGLLLDCIARIALWF
jgi:hypothetical protein